MTKNAAVGNGTRPRSSSLAEAITTCGSNLSVDDTDVLSWASSSPSHNNNQWEEHRDEISSMFDVIRSDRLREQDERYRHDEDKREMKENRKEMLQRWEDERQSIMRGAERGTVPFREQHW
jgi:hypothetical protein